MSTRLVEDPDELAELFGRDKHLHLYALADLEEPYWSASRWWRNGDAALGLVGLPDGQTIVYAVSSADPVGTLALAREIADQLPPTLITGVTGIASVFGEAGRGIVWQRSYHRFHLTDRSLVPAVDQLVQPLDRSDLDAALALYQVDPGAAFFEPTMLGLGTFVGVRADDDLIAIAGTHVLSEKHGVAGIGAVFTHPDHRGQGLGAAVTAGVIHRIGDRVDTIGLNCTESNTAARRIYLRMGFAQCLAYDECETSGSSGS